MGISLMLPYCQLYARAKRLTRVWGVLAMVTQECLDVGGIVRGMRAYYVACWLGGC
jgi:hypothetical protein